MSPARRPPPHDVEAEEAVLGAAMLDAGACAEVLGRLGAEDFYRPAHRRVFAAVKALAAHGGPVDAVTVKGELEKAGALADVGGAPFLHTLTAAVPTVAEAGSYAGIVAARARLRRLIDAGTQLVQVGYEEPDPDQAEAAARKLLAGVEGRGGPAQGRPFATVDLAALAKTGIPPPELLCGLLYRGGLHSLAGPPESGKSTLAYLWLLQRLAMGEAAVLLDEEAGREQVVEKLLALGADPAHLNRLTYVEFPGRHWDADDRRGLEQLLDQVRPTLLVADSSAAFLAVAGRDEDRATEVTPFYKLLSELARGYSTAAVILDHVAKNGQGGRYARGSGAKLATVDVAFMVDPVKPFTRHHGGLLTLTVTKDRRGYLHRDHEVQVEVEDGRMALAVHRVEVADSGELAGLRPAAVKILTALREAGGPLSWRAIGDQVKARHGHGLRRETISRECKELITRGLVDQADPGRHGASYWMAVNPP